MSKSRKFKKLALPSTSRQTSTQISKFFTQDKELSCSEPIPPAKRKLVENEDDINFVQSTDVSETIDNSESNKEQTIKFIKSFENEKQTTKRVRSNSRPSYQCNTISQFFSQPDNEFEISKNKPKQVKKVQPKKATSKSKISKKQIKINKAFMRSEEALFSEIIAQHSIADEVDPDELQLALTLSRSEHETKSRNCAVSDDYIFPEYLHQSSSTLENFRTKLQEFGFQVGDQKDYDISSFVRGNKKGKWASRLTPLTLRNPEKQKEKLEKKIDELLKFHDIEHYSKDMEAGYSFKLSSNFLSAFKSTYDVVKSKAELLFNEEIDISDFYVRTLFKPSTAKPCALLKSFEHIPGRDFSPCRRKGNKILKKIVLNKDQEKPTEMQLEESLEKLQSGISKQPLFNLLSNTDKESVSDISMEKIVSQNNSIQENIVKGQQNICTLSSAEMENLSTFAVTKTNYVRASSPDLFADCEGDSFEKPNNSLNEDNNKVITSNTNLLSESSLQGKECVKSSLKYNNESNEEYIEDMPVVADRNGIENFEKDTTDDDSSKNITKEYHENVLCVDLTQEDSDIEISEKYVKISFNDKQLSQDSSSTDCIILSDDEVNYSIKMAADIQENSMIADSTNSVDLTKSPFSDNHNDSCDHSEMHENDSLKSVKANITDEIKHTIFSNVNANETHIEENKNTNKFNEMELEYNNIQNESYIDLDKDTDDIDNDLISNINIDEQFPISPENLPTSKLDFNSDVCNSTNFDDTDFDLAKLKAKYGIRDIVRKLSIEPDLKSSKNFRKSISENIHTHTTIAKKTKLKKYSTSNKFSEFLDEEMYYSDIDEIDKLVTESPISNRMQQIKKPSDLESLLKGDITYKTKEILESPEEYIFNGKTYLIRTNNIPPKPDYANMDTPKRLRELHQLGLKPLKKKQAIIMLDYIYNQTHPIISDEESSEALRHIGKNHIQLEEGLLPDYNNLTVDPPRSKYNTFNLKDCFGHRLLCNDDEISPESKNEIYIFQTNIKSKIPNCLLPLHMAWFNLIKSNNKLREAILHYEPIDLQEIYIFLKTLGYRYDPKDIKNFFDRRCIIFRYDLSDGKSNRHVRKVKSSLKI